MKSTLEIRATKNEIRTAIELFRVPKIHEKIFFLIDGKPMVLPPSLKRYIDHRFSKQKHNYKIVHKKSRKVDE